MVNIFLYYNIGTYVWWGRLRLSIVTNYKHSFKSRDKLYTHFYITEGQYVHHCELLIKQYLMWCQLSTLTGQGLNSFSFIFHDKHLNILVNLVKKMVWPVCELITLGYNFAPHKIIFFVSMAMERINIKVDVLGPSSIQTWSWTLLEMLNTNTELDPADSPYDLSRKILTWHFCPKIWSWAHFKLQYSIQGVHGGDVVINTYSVEPGCREPRKSSSRKVIIKKSF